MKKPFNLVLTFSLASLIAITALMVGLSWLLGNRLESRLLARDQVLIHAAIQQEVGEELDEGMSFETIYQDPEARDHILEEILLIPGTKGVEILDTSGKVLWSTDSEKIGTERNTELLAQVLEGKSAIEFKDEDHTALSSSEEKSADWKADTGLYVPIVHQQEILGIFEIHRNNSQLRKQVKTLQTEVYWFCAAFGTGLYLLLMCIIIPAARIIRSQHSQLSSTAESLKSVNEELRRTQKELLQKERLSAIGEVCGAVAHGLKNPISSVRSAVQLLGTLSLSTDKREEITEDILIEVDRLAKRLNDLLNFIRPFDLNAQSAHLADIVTSAAASLKWKAEEEGIQLQTDLPGTIEPVSIDRSLMEEAVLIVLGNAMDASSPGQTVQCRLLSTKGRQTIVIQDEGNGIAPDVLPRVFECFFTTRSQGVGLGLALCKKIIELHQGKVTMESQEGKGTVVYLEIPSAGDPSAGGPDATKKSE
ncbi:MAG: hypothetical protein HQM14_18175 [SAR324 cluster bacterium]|nr:hypothetical protein [SAR324 cluster bacterium]